jgi:hypothetical protein
MDSIRYTLLNYKNLVKSHLNIDRRSVLAEHKIVNKYPCTLAQTPVEITLNTTT